MTRKQLLAAMALIEKAHGKNLTEDQVGVYFELLGDLDAEHFVCAVKAHLMENEFPGIPTVGRLRALASRFRDGSRVAPEEAFQEIHKAIVRFGYMRPMEAEKALGAEIWSVIEGVGGWQRFCDSPVDQRASLFAQFRDAWNGAQDRIERVARLSDDLRSRLVGIGQKSIELVAEGLSVGGGGK